MFITLEGIEGSGKTTQVARIAEYLGSKGLDCQTTREPGATQIGQHIRAILLNPENKEIDPLAELLLYMADRAQHLKEVIEPLLESGKTVICDRYVDATVAYQGFARQQDPALIQTLHHLLFKGLFPTITLLLDVSPEIGLSRAWQEIHAGRRENAETRFEKEAIEFHKRVRSGYLRLASTEPSRFRIIDAGVGKEQVTRQIIDAIASVMETQQ